MDSKDFVGMMIVYGICVVLPIMIVWLVMRTKKNETDKRTQILLAAIEKNADIDAKALTKMMTETGNGKTFKEKLLKKLETGVMMTLSGIALIGVTVYASISGIMKERPLIMIFLWGGALFIAIGIAYLISYYVGKRMLAKEIEREENNLPEE